MSEIFDVVYQFLKWISALTGFSYREVNIIIHFIVIPAFLFYLISRFTKQRWYILGFLILVVISLIAIPDFEKFASWLFDKSVEFLNWFEIIGLDYIQASVVICVFVPVLLILILWYFRNNKLKLNDVH